MLDKPLAIVDVETTGQSAVYGRIIEIAVIRIEHGSITQTFQSLVNPERYISPLIEGLTGITNADVADAPVFADIAGKVRKLLDGAIFVAHNARFDYAFVKNEFRALGRPFSARCLCTVKLSRKLFPQHRHHNLSSVIERHGISCDARHRAMGDAQAVYEFLRSIEEREEEERVRSAVDEILKASSLPVGLDRRSFDDLPELPGVYLLYGADGGASVRRQKHQYQRTGPITLLGGITPRQRKWRFAGRCRGWSTGRPPENWAHSFWSPN